MLPSELLADPGSWGQKYAICAGRMCIVGACYRAARNRAEAVKWIDMLNRAVRPLFSSIVVFNDAFDRKHAEVLGLLKSCGL